MTTTIETGWCRGLGLVAMAGFLALLWSAVCTAPAIPWNPARLAPSFALARGLPFYALRDSGAQLGWFYGPVFPLWYWPAALADNPTLALALAAIWNAATLLVPVGLVWRAAGAPRGFHGTAGLAVAGVFLLGNPVTRYHLAFVHVDALCLAFGLLACLGLHRAAREEGVRGGLHLAALSLVLAVWTKQLALMLAPALSWWLWHEGRHRLLWPLFFWCVVYGAAVTVAIFGGFGTSEVLFNTWLVHARNPWQGGLGLLGERLSEIVCTGTVWLPAAALAGWLMRAARWPALPPPAASFVRLLLGVAAWQLPLGLVAALKAGGGLNSVHALLYALVAGLIVVAHALAQPAPRGRSAWVAGLLGTFALMLPLGNAFRVAAAHGAAWTIYRGNEHLLAMARAQPGRYYFPWNPLITIISDRQIRPLDDALYCLWHVGLEPPVEKIRAAVPSDPIILYEEPAQSHFALRYFPRRRPAGGTPP